MHELKAEDPPWAGERDPWRWYSLNWSDRYTWKGDGCISEGEWNRWKSEVLQVHLKRRKVRYFHVPKSREWVRAARFAGVDLIDLDDLSLSSEGGRSVSVCARTK